MIKLDLPVPTRSQTSNQMHPSEAVTLASSTQIDCCSIDPAVAAITYARRGWAVLPIFTVHNGACTCASGARCSSPGKHPILMGGVNAATKNVDEVARLWREHPHANVGIATGRMSGIIALDVDPRNGGRETSRCLAVELGAPPRTVCADTGGDGYHRFFLYPDTPLATRHALDNLPGLDVQSDGAYVVAPPSRHASGQLYQWRQNRDPTTLPLAALPERWLARLRKFDVPSSSAPTTTSSMISEGGRNTHLTSRAGALRQAGLSADGLLAALKVENTERCTPPLDDEEVARIAASVGRYPIGALNSGDEAEGVMQAVLDQHFASGAHLLCPSDGHFWRYDGTRWTPIDKKVLSGTILTCIRGMPTRLRQNTSSLMRQVLTLIEAHVAADGDPLRFRSDPLRVINCLNGELWIGQDGSAELRPHSPTSYLRHRIDITYDPTAVCPRYDDAVLEIFGKAADPVAMAKFWDELMGYAMQPDRRIPLVMLGWGAGNNGKTRLLETYVRLVGQDQIMAMPIGDIDKSRFSTANLLGKLALIDDDVRSGTRLPDGQLKSLSEEKTITGEHKFGPTFTFTSRTAIFMLFNNPPSLADLSLGMQRRLYVVPFDRSFTAEETDKGLFKAIWAAEMPGVLNRYLLGLGRVIQRKWTFETPETADRAKEALLRAANPVPMFVAERCEDIGSVYVQSLYETYQDWAAQAGITKIPQRLAFQRSLESLGYTVRHGNRGPKFYGLKLRLCPTAP